jgi:hypothetical protein
MTVNVYQIMSPPSSLVFVIVFPLFWFAVTMLLNFVSGWFGLMERYPDRPESALAVLANQSGSLGVVSMRRVLKLGICPSGLRIGIMRIFGPFSRDFFVPWDEITVTRRDRLTWKVAKLSFGRPPIGNLTLPAEVADRIARTAGIPWPESGPFSKPTNVEVLSRIVKQWAAMTAFAAAFFIIAPRLLSPNRANGPPIAVAVLFPAIVFGIGAIVQYVRRNRS